MNDVQLLHGDCLKMIPKLPVNSVDLIIADLPYGVTNVSFDDARTRKRNRATPISKRVSAVNLELLKENFLRVAKRNAAFLFFASQPFACQIILAFEKLFKYELIWDKVHPTRWLHAKHMPLARHESIQVCYQKRPTYNPQIVARQKPVRAGKRTCTTLNYAEVNRHRCDPDALYTHHQPTSIVATKRTQRTIHPHQKPVALLEYLIRTYTNSGDTVLDPVAGSATTAIAAMRTGRKVICVEKDANYFAAMSKRVADERAKMQQSELAI